MKKISMIALALFVFCSTSFAVKLDHFSVKAPSSVRAGEKFLLVVEAQDSAGNIVQDYKFQGKSVELEIGTGELVPKLIPASEFKSGTIAIEVMCVKAQKTPIYAKDVAKYVYGRSELITIKPSKTVNFISTIPASGIRIEAFDAYGNPVTDYDLTGADVTVVAKEKGIAIPNEIPASAFNNGVATSTFIYDKPIIFELKVKEGLKKTNILEETHAVVVSAEEESITENNKKEAKQNYEKAVELMVEERYEEAKKELEKSLLLDPDNEKAKKLLKNLGQSMNKAGK